MNAHDRQPDTGWLGTALDRPQSPNVSLLAHVLEQIHRSSPGIAQEAKHTESTAAEPEYLRDIHVGFEGSGSHKELILRAVAAKTIDRLHRVLHARTQMPMNLIWNERTTRLDDLRDLANGQGVTVKLSSHRPEVGDGQAFWWGDGPDTQRDNNIPFGCSLVRLAIGPSGAEQTYKFAIARADVNEGSEAFYILREADLKRFVQPETTA